jgi:hypothetical protein
LNKSDRQAVAVKLREWGIALSDDELDQLMPAYQNLLRWQTVVEQLVHSKSIAPGMDWPESQPILDHCIEKTV